MADSQHLERWSRRIAGRARAPRGRDGLPPLLPDDLYEACDRIFAEVSEAQERWQLAHSLTELRFLTLHTRRLMEATGVTHGSAREVDAADRALQHLLEDLSRTGASPRNWRQSTNRFIELRTTLYEAVWRLRYALLLLGWAEIEKHRPRGL